MRSTVAIGLCVVWLLPTLADAQPAKKKAAKQGTQTEAQKAAEEHFQKGNAFFESGGFDWAIEEYSAAFELTGEPRFLFHLGRSHEDKGDKRKAVEYFERYLAADPDGPFSDEAGTHVAKLSAEIEHEEEVERERVEREQSEARERERKRLEAERRRELFEQALDRKRRQMLVEAQQQEAAVARAAARRACRNWRLRRAGLITMGVGVLSVALGLKFGLDAKSANDALTEHTTGAWTDDLLARQDEGETAERRMAYFTGFGGAALVTGGVLYLLGRRHADAGQEGRLSLRPSLGASSGTVSLVGSF